MQRILFGSIAIVGLLVAAAVLFIPAKLPEVSLFEETLMYPPFDQMVPLIIEDESGSDVYLVHPGVGTEVQRKTDRRNEVQAIRSTSGERIAFTSFLDPFWSVWVAENKGLESRISEGSRETMSMRFSENDQHLLILELEQGDIAGSVIEVDSGKREQFGSDIQQARWLNNSKGIVYLSKNSSAEDEVSLRLFNLDGVLGSPSVLSTGAWYLVGEYAASRFLVFAEFDGVIDLGLLGIDDTIERFAELAIPKSSTIVAAELSGDKKYVLFTTVAENGIQEMVLYRVDSKKQTTISENALDPYFVDEYLLYKEVTDGDVAIMVYDLLKGEKRALSDIDGLTY